MNWDEIEGNLKLVKGQAKQKWGKLTNDRSEVMNGKREQLTGKIQQLYGITKDEAENQLADWQKSYPKDKRKYSNVKSSIKDDN